LKLTNTDSGYPLLDPKFGSRLRRLSPCCSRNGRRSSKQDRLLAAIEFKPFLRSAAYAYEAIYSVSILRDRMATSDPWGRLRTGNP